MCAALAQPEGAVLRREGDLVHHLLDHGSMCVLVHQEVPPVVDGMMEGDHLDASHVRNLNVFM